MDVLYGFSKDFVFQAAVDYLESKEAIPAQIYKTLEQTARDRAFTVSGYTRGEILNQFLQELSDAVEEGQTVQHFRERMNDFLERNGYDAVNPWHTDVIFRTNVQTAYQAGHYQSMQAAKRLRPFWEYKTAGDGQVRESHAAMQGKVYAADDPIWDIWYPPNGYRCRCTVVSLSERQVRQRGIRVSREPPLSLTKNGRQPVYPDKGFSNNPAKTSWHPDLKEFAPALKSVIQSKKNKKRRLKLKGFQWRYNA